MSLAMGAICPAEVDELVAAIQDAGRKGDRLAIRGAGTKCGMGRAEPDARVLDMSGFSGVIDYDPAELVLTVGAGTPLAEVQALVASHEQTLAFGPFDHGPIYGSSIRNATLGGIVAGGVAGPLRLSQGGVRDHILGVEAVSGHGERFVAGARVVKNVTGYDLPKLLAGSWGRLAAMTQVTFKVLPAPRVRLTKLFAGLSVPDAIALMVAAMRAPTQVQAAAHIPKWSRRGERSLTALLLAGFPASVAARAALIDSLFANLEQLTPLEGPGNLTFWSDVAIAEPLPRDQPLWRINAPVRRVAELCARLSSSEDDHMLDWAGGLLWVSHSGDPTELRATVEAVGGQATLVRAPPAIRASMPALHPRAPGVAAIETRVRRAFDPLGVFETGRF